MLIHFVKKLHDGNRGLFSSYCLDCKRYATNRYKRHLFDVSLDLSAMPSYCTLLAEKSEAHTHIASESLK